jgi:hypothetical protein
MDIIKNNNHQGLVDDNNKIILPIKYKEIYLINSDKDQSRYYKIKEVEKYAIFDSLTNKIISKFIFSAIYMVDNHFVDVVIMHDVLYVYDKNLKFKFKVKSSELIVDIFDEFYILSDDPDIIMATQFSNAKLKYKYKLYSIKTGYIETLPVDNTEDYFKYIKQYELP